MQFAPRYGPRRIVRWIWIYFLYCAGVLRRARRAVARTGILVLTLHRVLDDPDLVHSFSPPGMALRRSTFESLLRYLHANCEVVSLDRMPELNRKRTRRPRFAITFDDGWRDTAKIAWPLARKHDLPISVFVCPGLAGKESPFWPELVLAALVVAGKDGVVRKEVGRVLAEAGIRLAPEGGASSKRASEEVLAGLKRLPALERDAVVEKLGNVARDSRDFSESCKVDATMDWEEMAEMMREGAQIGSHTHTHHILPTMTSTEAASELLISKKAIESNLGRSCSTFAYPNGSWSPEVRDLVKAAGYSLAFTNAPGVWTNETDVLLVPRLNVWEGTFCGPSGRFSPVVFQYATFWQGLRAKRSV